MRVFSLAAHAEPVLHRTFGRVGVLTSRAPLSVIATVVVLLVALSIGNWQTDIETSVNDLMIARRGRIADEKEFFVDNFDLISPELNSVIVTPKDGVNILSVEALDEVRALQESIRTFAFEYRPGLNVSLEQFCFKIINADPTEPCWQSSLLESFREGDVFNVGGELNSQYAVLFAPRPSYRDFDFTGLTRSFIAQTNLNPDSLLLGSFEVNEQDRDTITSVGALQIAFAGKSPEGLRDDGLQYFEWTEVEQADDSNGEICPDPATCAACADAIQPTQFAAAGCTFDGSPSQSAGCCAAMESLRSSPCVEVLFERRSELAAPTNQLLAACDLQTVEISPRCNNLDLIVGTRETSTPEVCVCLAGASDACTAAGAAFITENPEYAETFTAAASGDEAAVAELGQILVVDVGCEPPEDQATAEPPSAAEEDVDVQDLEVQTTYAATVSVITEETDTIDKARNVMHEWEKAWRKAMGDIVRDYQYIDVVWITATSVDDEVEEAAAAEIGLFILGYGLVLAYILIVVTFEWRSGKIHLNQCPPGPGISILCFFVVLLSVAGTIGVAGYVSALTSFKVSFSAIQMIPLLLVGLGVNDFFVLCSALKSVIANPTCPRNVADIMYETMAIGGTSITLSSAANAAAFSLGSLTSLPIVLWFSVQMSVGVVIAYIVSITAIPSFLSIAVDRHLNGGSDFLLLIFGIKPVETMSKYISEEQPQRESAFAGWVRRNRWLISGMVFAVFTIWMTMGMRQVVHFEQGVVLSETVSTDGHTYNFLKASEQHFDTTQINIVFKDTVDYSDPAGFQSARQSEFEYVNNGHRTEKQLMAQSWMEFYTQYVESKFCANEICMNEVNWYYDGFSSREFGHPSRNICNEAETPEECQEMCATHCPQGEEGSEFRCQYTEGTTECYCPYRPMLQSSLFYENPDGFNSRIVSYWSDFLVNSTVGRASRQFINLDAQSATKKNPVGIPEASRSFVYARDLQSVHHQLDHIKQGRAILDSQPIDVFAFDYLVYAIGEQYDNLALETVKAVGISMAVATVVMLPLILNSLTALIVALCVLLSVLLTAGTSSWTVINFDYSAYMAFVVTVGLSVEFCAHIARDFMLASGDRLARATHALETMGVAVFNGGVTTFLGILPAVLSDMPAIRDRLFVQFSIVVLAGLFIGLLFLPTVLSFIGPASFASENEVEIEMAAIDKPQKYEEP